MEQLDKKNIYGARIKDKNVLMESTSGGVFTSISDEIIHLGGFICGAIYTSDYKVKHVITDSYIIRDKMRGAKYVQSNIKEVIPQVLDYLRKNRIVLFCGTPCQVAAIKKLASLKKIEKKLITIDIICHGVPSPKIFEEHIKMIENKYGTIKSYVFRDKQKGWRGQNVTIISKNGIVPDVDARLYSSLYFNSLIIRPSCTECKYANVNRVGDITIGDFWGISKEKSVFNDNLGISQVMLNTNKGKALFERIKSQLEYFEVKSENYIQPNMKRPTEKSLGYEAFWRKYQKGGLKNVKLLVKYFRFWMLPYRVINKIQKKVKI